MTDDHIFSMNHQALLMYRHDDIMLPHIPLPEEPDSLSVERNTLQAHFLRLVEQPLEPCFELFLRLALH